MANPTIGNPEEALREAAESEQLTRLRRRRAKLIRALGDMQDTADSRKGKSLGLERALSMVKIAGETYVREGIELMNLEGDVEQDLFIARIQESPYQCDRDFFAASLEAYRIKSDINRMLLNSSREGERNVAFIIAVLYDQITETEDEIDQEVGVEEDHSIVI